MFPSNYLSPVPRHGLPGHPFTYFSPLSAPSPLLLSIPIPPVRIVDKHASYVWNASIVLADMIANEEIDVKGKRVLELGCGVGLPSCVAAYKEAELVVLSDFNDSRMLSDLREAVDEAVVSAHRARVKIVGHSFGEPTKPLLKASPSYDRILVADCIWDRSLHEPLIQSLVELLTASPQAIVHLSAGFHTSRKVIANFLELAQRRGIAHISQHSCYEISVEGEKRRWEPDKGKFEEKQEERNRWTFVGAFELAGK